MPPLVVVDPPSWQGAANARNLTALALRLAYRLHPHGAHHVGTSGALLMVARCEGVLAGSVLRALCPRPIHVVANEAMDVALPHGAMVRSGDVPISGPFAVATQRTALAALADERAVAVVGAAVPVGYLVAATGVEVMPVVLFGAQDQVLTDPPRPRSRIDVYFAPPVAITVQGDPLRSATRAAVAEQVRQIVADAEHLAAQRSGR